MVVNLLGNSIKFTDPGGRIHLAVQQQGRETQITIVDNGIGIAPELLPKIFDLFVQANTSPDRAHGGLGLGFTLVRRIIEGHVVFADHYYGQISAPRIIAVGQRRSLAGCFMLLQAQC